MHNGQEADCTTGVGGEGAGGERERESQTERKHVYNFLNLYIHILENVHLRRPGLGWLSVCMHA